MLRTLDRHAVLLICIGTAVSLDNRSIDSNMSNHCDLSPSSVCLHHIQALHRALLLSRKELTRDVNDYLVCLVEHVRELRSLQVG